MDYYTHYKDLIPLPATPIDWVAEYNTFMESIARGRTLKLTAYENLVLGDPFYISSDSKAHKASDATIVNGIWLSSSTSTNVTGYGQIEGLMDKVSWGWTPGVPLYVNSSKVLTDTISSSGWIVGKTISATLVNINCTLNANITLQFLDGRDSIDSIVSSAITANYDNSASHWIELTENTSLTISNISNGGRMVIVLKQGSGGSKLITSWIGIDYWQGGVTPTLTITAGHFDIITLVKSNDKVFAAATLDLS